MKKRYRAFPKKVTKAKKPKIVKLINKLSVKTKLPKGINTFIPQGQHLVNNMNNRAVLNKFIDEYFKTANQRLYKMERYDVGLYTKAYKTAKHDVGLDLLSKQAVRFMSSKSLESMTVRDVFHYAQAINQFLSAPTTLTQLAQQEQTLLKKYLPFVDDESQLTKENMRKFYDFINDEGGTVLTKMGLDSSQLFQGFFESLKQGMSQKEVKEQFNKYMDRQTGQSWDEFVKEYKKANKQGKKDLYEGISEIELDDIEDILEGLF